MSVNIFDLADTWNDPAVNFQAIKMNVTDTASGSASQPLEILVNNSPILWLAKSGRLDVSAGCFADSFSRRNLSGATLNGTGISLTNSSMVLWTEGSATNNTFSSTLRRDGATGTLALRNGTTPQIFRVHNTFTDASNYERATLGWVSNTLRIGTEHEGTGVARALSLVTGGVDRLFVNAIGNVGIGTNTPGQVLHLFRTSHTNDVQLRVTNNGFVEGSRSSLCLEAKGTNGHSARVSIGHVQDGVTAGVMVFRTHDEIETMRISAWGNIGIGTATPNALLDLARTWNNADFSFRGIRLNVTNTASSVNSALMELLVGGGNKFRVSRTGGIEMSDPAHRNIFECSHSVADVHNAFNKFGSGHSSGAILEVRHLGGSVSAPAAPVAGTNITSLSFRTGGSGAYLFGNPSFAIRHTIGSVIGDALSSVDTSFLATGTADGVLRQGLTITGQDTWVRIHRGLIVGESGSGFSLTHDGSQLAAFRNSTNPQTLRVYNTFTNSSNHERGIFSWVSNVLRIGTEHAGTGVARPITFWTSGLERMRIAADGRLDYVYQDGAIPGEDLVRMHMANNGNNMGEFRLDLIDRSGDTFPTAFINITPEEGVIIDHPYIQLGTSASLVALPGWTCTAAELRPTGSNAVLGRVNATGYVPIATANINNLFLHNTFTNTSNYERGFVRWVSNVLEIATERLGTGSARPIIFRTNGTNRMQLGAAGALTINIGAAQNFTVTGLPTVNPNVAGALWNDAGTLKVSAG